MGSYLVARSQSRVDLTMEFDTIWERVAKECVPPGQERVTAIDAAGQLKWATPAQPCDR